MPDSSWIDEAAASFLAKRATTRAPRLRKAARDKLPFLKLTIPELVRLGCDQRKLTVPAVILLLEMVRLSGLRLIRNRDGWTSLEHAGLEDLGLADKDIRHRAVRKLVALGCLETRGINASGRKLEYRLTPNWADPPAQVIDLATVRTTRKRKS